MSVGNSPKAVAMSILCISNSTEQIGKQEQSKAHASGHSNSMLVLSVSSLPGDMFPHVTSVSMSLTFANRVNGWSLETEQ